MHNHTQNLQKAAQLARALAIQPFSDCMGRKYPCPLTMHLKDHAIAYYNLQLQVYQQTQCKIKVQNYI